MKKRQISWDEIMTALEPIDKKGNVVYGVPKGGMIAAGFLRHAYVTYDPNIATVIIDDLMDSGATKARYEKQFPTIPFIDLIQKYDNEWLVFPWEQGEVDESGMEENLVRVLQYLGEDPNREGLQKTPHRIIKSWEELYCGYEQDPKSLLTTFDSDGYDQIVLLKDIELYSMCEHHMLPFFGKAHVAYIPNKRVIGISKLARLADMFARRLQIQERLGEQVTSTLMEILQPKGAACIIEAQHMCMRMRGCSKQNSMMVTSSLKGCFLDEASTRAELMQLIK